MSIVKIRTFLETDQTEAAVLTQAKAFFATLGEIKTITSKEVTAAPKGKATKSLAEMVAKKVAKPKKV